MRRSRFESGEVEPTNWMKPKELRRSPAVLLSSHQMEQSKPRKPSRDEKPIRPLSENWAEYMTAEKRFYYYNSRTGATSWKPPRIHSSLHRHGESSVETSHSSLILEEAVDHHPNISILREEEDSEVPVQSEQNGFMEKEASLPQLPVPDGWSYFYDGTVGQGYFVNDITGARVRKSSSIPCMPLVLIHNRK